MTQKWRSKNHLFISKWDLTFFQMSLSSTKFYTFWWLFRVPDLWCKYLMTLSGCLQLSFDTCTMNPEEKNDWKKIRWRPPWTKINIKIFYFCMRMWCRIFSIESVIDEVLYILMTFACSRFVVQLFNDTQWTYTLIFWYMHHESGCRK